MKKRLISIFLILAFIINLLPLCGCNRLGGFVSRGEWIEMLSLAFGMDSYTEDTPFYADVPADSEYFTYVQSAAEWQVLEVFTGDKLDIDKAVTCEQVAGTAAVAAGFLGDGESFDADAALNYARENGIVARDRKATRKMNQEDCEAAIAAAKKLYLSAPMSEKIFAVINPELVNLGNVSEDNMNVEDSRVTFPMGGGSTSPDQPEETDRTFENSITPDGSGGYVAEIETESGAVQIKPGDVFTTPPTPEHPFGVAYKVISVREENGEIIVETGTPALEDLYDELSVHTTVSADPANIIWADGVGDDGTAFVQASTDGKGFTIELLGAKKPALSAIPMKSTSFSKTLEFGNGSFNSSWSNKTPSVLGSGSGAQAFSKSNFAYDGNPSIEDFGGSTDSWKKDLTITNQFSSGYKIIGTINVNALDITTDIEYNKVWAVPVGIKSASLRLDSNISASLRMEGQMGEKLKIATMPIPIGATGLSVSVDLYLYANGSGHLEVGAELSNTAKIEYANKKVKHSESSTATSNTQAALKVNFGADVSATLDAIGIVKIMDAGARVGGELDAEAGINGSCMAAKEGDQEKLTYQESMYIKADLYAPIVDLYTGGSGTLLSSLGLNKTWNVITKAGAKQTSLVDFDWKFWEEVVLKDGDEVQTEETTSGDDGVGSTDESRLRLSTYVLVLDVLENGSKRIELEVYDGETTPDVVWTSNDPSVATVDDTGLVSLVSEGSTYITAQLRDDPSVYATCAIFVGNGKAGNGFDKTDFLNPDLPTA